jgi:hypothetical protein
VASVAPTPVVSDVSTVDSPEVTDTEDSRDIISNDSQQNTTTSQFSDAPRGSTLFESSNN